MEHLELCQQIENEIREVSSAFEDYQVAPTKSRSDRISQLIRQKGSGQDSRHLARVLAEFEGLGPIEALIQDPDVTEIMINGPQQIWFEKEGRLHLLPDQFATELSYRNFGHRLLAEARVVLTSECPTAQGQLRNFRMHAIGGELIRGPAHFCLRRHPENPWTFDKLAATGWGDDRQRMLLRKMVAARVNFMVVGPTGSGKTSVLNACLQELPSEERCILIEDTLELKIPNGASLRLLTREDPNGILKRIDQSELVKNSLRLRPDRIVMGEVRGEEAKDFLMALSTGHAGSFGSLHAASAGQALIRLEMLIQLGAPKWSLHAIRRLIQMSLEYIVVVGREKSGKRCLQSVQRLASLEENGLLLENAEGSF